MDSAQSRHRAKVYDLCERMLAAAFGDDLPRADDCLRDFVRRTVRALGIVRPSWLWDYFRLAPLNGQTRAKKVHAATKAPSCRRQWMGCGSRNGTYSCVA
jgi:uncharacterized protein YcaQ